MESKNAAADHPLLSHECVVSMSSQKLKLPNRESSEIGTNMEPKNSDHEPKIRGVDTTIPKPKLKERLDALSPERLQPTIFKVNDVFNVNNACKPKLVAIGPYHSHEENLKKMDVHKLYCLQAFLDRRTLKIDDCKKALESLEAKARACYDETISLSFDEFVEMLVLDGCFIIQFIHGGDNNIIDMDWMNELILEDLILFDNQLPFFVLRELCSLNSSQDIDEKELVSNLLERYKEAYRIKAKKPTDINSANIKHLLHLVYETCQTADACLPTEKLGTSSIHSGDEAQQQVKWSFVFIEKIIKEFYVLNGKIKTGILKFFSRLLKNLSRLLKFFSRLRPGKSKGQLEWYEDSNISATRLAECNVKFEGIELKSNFGIIFENGLMSLQYLRVSDRTEPFFRNLIAYEHYFRKGNERHVTSYCELMDYLIDTPEDVKILIKYGVIKNGLGSNEAIADMFNKLSKHVTCSFGQTYTELLEKIKGHCNKKRNAWMAVLKHSYLSNPWRFISVVAAFILLGLTALQTVYAIKK